MSQIRVRSKRTELRRFRVSSRALGRLVSMNGDRLITVRPTDVSRRGLGFIAREPLPHGGHFWLEIDEARLRVEVTHCHSHLGIENMYQCGVFTRDPDVDLEQVFAGLGLLEETLQVDGF
ncbi:hypothetical protein EBZ80_15245 [bacterium]|nr:hypothetical protein [bacterium]